MYKIAKYVTALAIILMQTESLIAQTWTNPGTGLWITGTNWSTAAPPTIAQTATIDNGGNSVLSAAPGVTSGLRVGGATLSSLVVDSGATLTSANSSDIGVGALQLGQVTITGAGTIYQQLTGNLRVGGLSAIAEGKLSVLDGAKIQKDGFNQIQIGFGAGKGELLVSDPLSSFTTPTDVFVGVQTNSEGVFNLLNGATATFRFIQVGQQGAIGSANISGPGTILTATNTVSVGVNGGSGELNLLSGAQINSSGFLRIGFQGVGTANVSGINTQSNVVLLSLGELTGNGTMSIDSGAKVIVSTSVNLTSTNIAGVALLNLNGAAGARGLLAANNVVGGSGVNKQINFDGGILQARANNANFISGFDAGELNIEEGGAFIDSQNFNIATDATSGFSGLGQVTKVGSGTFTTNANNTNAGWNVNEGTVIANALLTGPAIVNNTASLIVNGNILGSTVVNDFGAVVVNGTLNGPATVNNNGQLGVDVGGLVTGPATINDNGVVVVNGTVLGLVTTNDSGILYGTGTVGSLINGGIVAPGNADIGTLTVLGNHVNTPSGTHQNELNAAGQTDLLAVGGTSTLQGGTLDIQAAPGAYLAGTSYTLITAAGGLSGQFATVIDNLPINYLLLYFPNSLVLRLGDAVNLNGLTGNPRRVAEYINTFGSTFTGDFLTVLDALQSLSFDDLSDALDQLHPAPFQALTITSGDAAHMVNDSFMDRLNFLRAIQCGPCNACDPCSQGGVWISGLANYVDQDRSQGLRGFDATNGGFAVGYDKCFCDNIIAGIGSGYSTNYIKWNKSYGHSDGQNAYLGIYATQFDEDYYADVSLLGFKGTYKSKRHIEFATIDRRAKSKQCNWGINPHFGSGLILDYCGFDVIPFGEIDYYYISQDKFHEHGANSLNLRVKSNDASQLRLETGVRFAKAYDCGCGQFLPYASISYVGHRYYGRKFKSSFNDQPENFSVFGTDRCFNQAEFGLGLAYLINDQFAINASYDIDVGSKRQQQEFNFELNYRF